MSLDMVALVTVLALRRLYLLKFLGSGGFGAAFASMMLPEYGPPQEVSGRHGCWSWGLHTCACRVGT